MDSSGGKNKTKTSMKKGGIVTVAIVIITLVFVFFWSNSYNKKVNEIKRLGVFTLGEINDITVLKNGVSYVYKFTFESKDFNGTFRSSGKSFNQRDKIFVAFIPSDPEKNMPIRDLHVPDCLSFNEVPKNGWKKLPEKDCR